MPLFQILGRNWDKASHSDFDVRKERYHLILCSDAPGSLDNFCQLIEGSRIMYLLCARSCTAIACVSYRCALHEFV